MTPTQKSYRTTVLALAAVLASTVVSVGHAYAQDRYGAIAYSRTTGAQGYSYNYSTRSVAEGRAYNECESRSGRRDCRVLIWFRNACGAVATSENGAYGSAWSTDVRQAKNIALNSCRNYGGRYCKVTSWACTDR